jgi:hypothetical protein
MCEFLLCRSLISGFLVLDALPLAFDYITYSPRLQHSVCDGIPSILLLYRLVSYPRTAVSESMVFLSASSLAESRDVSEVPWSEQSAVSSVQCAMVRRTQSQYARLVRLEMHAGAIAFRSDKDQGCATGALPRL